MKRFKTKMMAGAALGLAMGAGLLVGATPNAASAAPGKATQRVTVVVDSSGYKPATVNVKAGQPVQLTFLSKGSSCANTVSVPALKKTLSLKTGQKKTLTFTPKKGQTLAFACPMKMYQGKVVAR
ncbi:MAG TPA: cupredoxin domain-containing protein [Chloroflexota bacterium]|nr:cupredoxin domain-containing protein [Chloroflexota bacterium]